MQFALQNSDLRRILLSDSTTPKADLFHSTMQNLLSDYFAKMLSAPLFYMESNSASN